MLEFLIKRREPRLHLRCGDFAPASVDALRQRFPDAQVELMNLKNLSWVGDPNEAILLNRVDTELDDRDWTTFFESIALRGGRRIIFVPSGLLTTRSVLREAQSALAAVMYRRSLRPAGFLRTTTRMQQLFAAHYLQVEASSAGGLPIWGLELAA
jgi:hypothetical protein